MSFLNAFMDPGLPFIRYALMAGLLSCFTLGIVGTHVVVNRISYIAGAISHASLAGIGASLYLSSVYGIEWISPLGGAVAAAGISGTIIALVSFYAHEREDTIIGTVWAVGMSLGIVFMALTPGYINPMSYLFGNILLISRTDLVLILSLDAIVLLLGIGLHRLFQMVTFDRDFASVRGVRPFPVYLTLILLISLTTVILSSMVGIVMVIALLTIPAATAGMLSRSLTTMMMLAAVFSAVSTTGGLIISYYGDLPSGALSILFAGTLYLAIMGVKGLIRKRRQGMERRKG